MNYKPYSCYKDSNVDWLNKIPQDWEVSLLKRFIYSISSGKTKNKNEDDGKYPLYGSTGVIGTTNCLDYNGTYILIARVGAYAGKTHIAKGKMGITDNTLIVDYSPKIYYKFLYYILSSYDFKILTIGSGQPLITGNDVKNIKISIPPIHEQKQIANYLDNKTSKIDTTIAKNKELINLLEEKRTALINQVVTKGLNPEVPMKDSGIEWIGEIPEHWDINNLNYVASDENYSFIDGPFGSDLKNEEYVDEGVPIIQLNNIKIGYHDFTNERFISEKKYNQLKKHSIKPGNIVIAKMAEPVARGTIVSNKYDRYVIVADCIKLACNSKFSNRYVTYSLNSYIYHEAVQKATGTTRVRINLQEMKKLNILIPPIEEQNDMANYLDNEILNINKIISKIKENINLLEEYKTSLIHHVVTGKIDVRGEEI